MGATPEPDQSSTVIIAYRPNYLWVAIFLGMLVIILSYGLEWQFAFGALLLVVGCIVFTALRPSQWLAGCGWLLAFGVLLAIGLPNCGPRITNRVKNSRVREGLRSIQLNLECYAAEHHCYPTSIQQLLQSQSPKTGLPADNFYNADKTRDQQVTWIESRICMHPVIETGWPKNLDDLAGDFFYIPHFELVQGEALVTSYDLVAFGRVAQARMRECLFPVASSTPILHLAGSLDAARTSPGTDP